ncbi:hypothetical protein ACQP2T_50305 [Nonomuraea sp. CA-143628]|uniref:hypothetical protein n=1 Tax=Nonomuraea sp. CA-143628 TaxID=3239997 RepID=UPI003D8B1D9E
MKSVRSLLSTCGIPCHDGEGRIGDERLGRAGMSIDLSNIPAHDQNLVLARMWHPHAERAD